MIFRKAPYFLLFFLTAVAIPADLPSDCGPLIVYDARRLPSTTNHYQRLGVRQDATAAQIDTAYRELALMHHSDHGGRTADMQELNAAAEVLRDPARRAFYDAELCPDSDQRSLMMLQALFRFYPKQMGTIFALGVCRISLSVAFFITMIVGGVKFGRDLFKRKLYKTIKKNGEVQKRIITGRKEKIIARLKLLAKDFSIICGGYVAWKLISLGFAFLSIIIRNKIASDEAFMTHFTEYTEYFE